MDKNSANKLNSTSDRTLILGGGVFALGCALATPQNTLVLERGIHLGADIALTGDYAFPGTPISPQGLELFNDLTNAGLLKDNRLELPPLADFLACFFTEHGGHSLMNAELVSLVNDGKHWNAVIYGGGAAGLIDYSFQKVLDTTAAGWQNRGIGSIKEKQFGAITGKGFFSVILPPDSDWRTARLALYRDFEQKCPDDRILAETGEMKVIYKDTPRVRRRFSNDMEWIPAAQFPTLFDAFEEGLKCSFA